MSAVFLADVALLSPPYATLTYSLPPWLPQSAWAEGLRVGVPLGKGCRAAVILVLRKQAEGETPPAGLKPLLWPLERAPMLSPEYLDLTRQLSLRQFSSVGRILGTVLPAPLRSGKARIRFFTEECPDGARRDVTLAGFAALPEEEKAACGAAWTANRAFCLDGGCDPFDLELCSLAQDPPWPVRPRAHRQTEMLEYLLARGCVSRRRLAEDLGRESAATLALLVRRGLVLIRPGGGAEKAEPAGGGVPAVWNAPFELTPPQSRSLDAFVRCLDAGEAATHLLHGITGSGKTAVYLALAAECLRRGRSVMLLAPEVALAHKLRTDVETHLPGATLFFFHGYQSAPEREAAFRALAERSATAKADDASDCGDRGPEAPGGCGAAPRSRQMASSDTPCLIVGTRSALFLPVRGLGAIILDEEHDSSFKQDEGLPYQAKEIAWYRAGREKALLLLGSATPDVKTYYAARQGQLPLHHLGERVGGGVLPPVRLVPVPRSMPDGSVLAEESAAALAACVDRGDQAVILLNRRGYAPLMYCLSCGEVLRCPHCAISLTYHKGRERAVCHYCGHALPYPSPCPACGGMHFLPMGEGTEKLEESLVPRLRTGTRILRLDRDSTRRAGRMEEILGAFARGEAQVLVGTQMLSKGHHFPDVTLVVAADADLGLNLPDYRAAERTFQLLVQAAGRAGRGEKPGEVLIQTRDPSHYCWQYVRTADYAGFYAEEIARREKRLYPPFVRLALVRMSFPADWAGGVAAVEDMAKTLRGRGRELGLTVLGPAPSPIAMLRGFRRFHCLIKAAAWGPVRELYAAALRAAGRHPKLRLALDMDPVNML